MLIGNRVGIEGNSTIAIDKHDPPLSRATQKHQKQVNKGISKSNKSFINNNFIDKFIHFQQQTKYQQKHKQQQRQTV